MNRLADRAATAGRDERLQDMRHALQFGVLWGLATAAMESMAVAAMTAGSLVGFSAPVALFWALHFVPLAWLALRLERRYSGWRLFGVALPAAVVLVWGSIEGIQMLLPPSRFLGPFLPGIRPSATLSHDGWGMLFYGGLLLVGCIVGGRASRLHRLLHQAEIDRGLTEALVAEIRLKELQGSVNPQVLYDALAEVMQRYDTGSLSADRLLDGLVGFLRTAMPSLRGGASTLAAELEVVRSYAQLRRELYPEHGAWRIEAAHDLGSLAFPPLQLVDMIDRCLALEAGRAGGVMLITRRGGGTRVELHANAVGAGPASTAGPPCMTLDFFDPAQVAVTS